MTFRKKILIRLLCLFILSCSTQKDKYINRQYHLISTKYNVLFNGENAFAVGVLSVDSGVTLTVDSGGRLAII